jgi:hypothetical protein
LEDAEERYDAYVEENNELTTELKDEIDALKH